MEGLLCRGPNNYLPNTGESNGKEHEEAVETERTIGKVYGDHGMEGPEQ